MAELVDVYTYLPKGREVWSDKYHEHGDYHPLRCIACGRMVKPEAAVHIVLGGGGNGLYPAEGFNEDTAMEEDDGYLGAAVLGPECGRTIPAEYRIDLDRREA
jgi:hypothetical protein